MTNRGYDGGVLVSFVFLDVTDVKQARDFFENGLELPLAENRFHPPHHIHGIVKYDAGATLFCLNKARPAFNPTATDGARILFAPGSVGWAGRAAGNTWITTLGPGPIAMSADNQVFWMGHNTGGPGTVTGLEFDVDDLDRTHAFLTSVLQVPVSVTGGSLTADTKTMPIVYRQRLSSSATRRIGTFLTVLHTDDIERMMWALDRRGAAFLSGAQESRIGHTVRFADPDGHHFCLYQPSAESLSWESGPTLRRLIGMEESAP